MLLDFFQTQSSINVISQRINTCCHVWTSQCLYEAGVKRKGTDVGTWISIMAKRSVPHLQKGELHLQLWHGSRPHIQGHITPHHQTTNQCRVFNIQYQHCLCSVPVSSILYVQYDLVFFYIQCKCFYYYCPVITLHAFNGNRFFLFFQTLFILSYIFVSMTRFFFTLDNSVFHLQYLHLFVLNTKMFYMFNSI